MREFSTSEPLTIVQKLVQEIAKEIAYAIAQLKRWQTWTALGLIALFVLLAYLVGSLALKTDSVVNFLRHTASSCRQMGNASVIFLFCGMIFFVFAAVLTLGEYQQYLSHRQHNALRQARRSLYWGLGWAGLAIAIAVAALIFFNLYCR